MRRAVPLLLALLAVGLLGLGLLAVTQREDAPVRASLAVAEAMSGDTTGYARALEPRPFMFPADHGPHPGFKTEWWYWTGNLAAPDGRRFGYQFTLFRSALSPDTSAAGGWRTNNLYLGHFALTDPDGAGHLDAERFARGAAGLAGAQAEPFRVWLESWEASGLDGADRTPFGALPVRLRAQSPEEGGFGIELELTALRDAVLQGDRGLSQKGAGAGNASYYYSLTRLPTTGTVTVGGEVFRVEGLSWMDREWSTSALAPDQVGWDWFSLQLADGRDLMIYQLRRTDGSQDPLSKGVLVLPDGSYRTLPSDAFSLEPMATWTSPRGGSYPVAWRVRVPSDDLDLTVEGVIGDQEMETSVRYWEGMVTVTGTQAGSPLQGRGYLEMTGYADVPRPRAEAE